MGRLSLGVNRIGGGGSDVGDGLLCAAGSSPVVCKSEETETEPMKLRHFD